MSKRGVRTLAVLVAAAVVALGIYLAVRFALGPADPALTQEAARALIQTKNVGLGQLENQRLDDGLAAFEQIAAQAPTDPLGPRNIAVARVLALGAEDGAATEAQVAAAQAALAKMRNLEGETTAWHWLALSAALAAKDFAAAELHLNALNQADPDDPAAWYARYRTGRLADARQLDPAASAALTKAFELRPTNAWLVVEWLRATGSELNEEPGALPADEAARTAASN